jgi:cysteine-rich repeat protein
VRTDPRDPDTDGDGRTDGQEAAIGSNPLRPDLSVTVTYTALEVHPPQGENPMEWKWSFFVQKPGGDFPGEEVSNQFDCERYDSCYCITPEPTRTLPLNKSFALDLAPGEALVLNGIIRETTEDHSAACPDGNTSVYVSNHDGDRILSFIDTPITYEQLQGGQFLSRSLPMTSSDDDSGTAATLFVEISVNCAGSGRGICRAGSLCVSDDDCETGHCDPVDATHQRCVDYCGNGAPDSGETCDDGNTAACGSCNADCSGTLTFPGCAGGTGCVTGADCASGTCVTIGGRRVCTSQCGNGWVEGSEACDDGNTASCGSCNSNCTAAQGTITACANGIGCHQGSDCASGSCVNGHCGTACGNGVLEAGETCDDRNTNACGTCAADCHSSNSPVTGCANGIACSAPADCASGHCSAAGLCVP